MLIRPYKAGEELDLLAVFQFSVRGLALRNALMGRKGTVCERMPGTLI